MSGDCGAPFADTHGPLLQDHAVPAMGALP